MKKSEQLAKIMCVGAVYCAVAASAYAVHEFIGTLAEMGEQYLLVDVQKKCSVYEVGKNRVKVCPSRSSQK